MSFKLLFSLSVLFQALTSKADVQLPVKRLEQKYQFSCETAALATVLNYYGVNVTEDQIISKMPFDKTKHQENIWGDPDQGFVGDINGKSGDVSYGIHWNPMKKVASNWMKAEVLKAGKVEDLVDQLNNKRPVIIWVYTGEKKPLKWKTPKGKTISALLEEHTVVVSGYKESKNTLSGFYIVDPAKNKSSRFVALGEFKKYWEGFGNKGLIVYP